MSSSATNSGAAACFPDTVDTERFMSVAELHDQKFAARRALFNAIHRREPTPEDDIWNIEHTAGFPTAIAYRALAVYCSGYLALRAIEAIPNSNRVRDALAVTLARHFCLPLLDEELSPRAALVVDSFEAWRGGEIAAEEYGKASLFFRVDIAPTFSSSPVSHLLDALPSDGVDWYGYRDGSSPASQWYQIGQYEAITSKSGKVIEDLRFELGADDPDIDDEEDPCGQWWNETLDGRIDAIAENWMAGHEDTIKGMIAKALAASNAE